MLLYMKVGLLDSDPSKTRLGWDGFRWVPKINTMKNIDPNFLSQTKKDRRIEIRNLPLFMGLTKDDLKKIVVDYIVKHYFNDPGNTSPLLAVDVDKERKVVVIETSSVEESNRLTKLDFIELLGVKCKLVRCSDTLYGNETSMVNKLQMAQVD